MRVDRLEDATILHGMVRLGMELAGALQCLGVIVFVVTTSSALFHSIDLAIVFLSTLALVIVTAVTPLITLVAVVAGVIALVAAVKIVVPTMVAAVVIVVWGWSEHGTLAASSIIIFLASSAFAYFLAVARSAVTNLGLLRRSLSLRASWKRRPVMKASIASLSEIDGP